MADRSFGYSAQVRPFLWVFLVLTPVEILLVPWFWLRYAREFEYRIPLAAIENVTHGRTSRSLHRTRSVVDGTLVLEISNSTNVLVRLSEPQEIDLGRHGVHTVSKIEFWADDPADLVRALRK